LTHRRVILSAMTSDPRLESPRDLRAIHRDASARVSAAVRGGHVRDAIRWGRAVKRALRALRFAARIRSGTVRNWIFDDSQHLACSHRSHPEFSAAPDP